MNSLQTRLALFLVVPFVLLLPLTASLLYLIALLPMRTALDHGLENVAIAVSGFVREDGARVRLDIPRAAEIALHADRLDTVFIALVRPGGELLDGDEVLAGLGVPTREDETVFYDYEGAQGLRVAARGVRCGSALCQVRVAETLRKRELLGRDILLGSVAAMVVLLLIVGSVMVIGARQSLRPVTALGRQAEARSIDDLSPLSIGDVPDEVAPLVNAVNRMLVRLREAAVSHHDFIANAAHQLRTPLAALLTQIELAQHATPGPQQYEATLAQLREIAERMARTTSQLLLLARSERSAELSLLMRPLDLRDVVSGAAREWVARAIDVDADLGFELQEARVRGESHLLQELLNNLVDNALRYGGRRITVRTGTDAGHAYAEVEDDGPGVPRSMRGRIFERFVRGATGGGSGLGLAIVRQIAERHGATVRLGSARAVVGADRAGEPAASPGLRVRITFAGAANGSGDAAVSSHSASARAP